MSSKDALTVRTNVLKRAVKDLKMYRNEVTEGETTLSNMTPSDDKFSQLERVLVESKMALEDATQRLEDAKEDLEMIVEDETAAHDPEKLAIAKELLTEAA